MRADVNEYFGWQYLRGTSQELALSAPADHILYHGTRGPGKTDTQLMRFRKRVGLGYGHFWRGVIFDREYKNLDDLVTKSKRWFPQFNDGCKFLAGVKDFKWIWPTGEELLFRHAAKASDYWKYHGHEYPFIGFNELTKYPSREVYDMMLSLNRSSFVPERDTPRRADGTYATHDGQPLPPIPLEVFSTTNPYGAGHAWVKRDFIDAAPDCTILKRTIEIYQPREAKHQTVTVSQVAIKGHWSENPYLDPKYIAQLHTISDEDKRRAWKDGDWNINAGGAIADLWTPSVHVIPRFAVPANWRVFRAFDWGSSHPFSVGWWAEANGEEVEIVGPDGEKHRRYFPPKTLIRFWEWYGYSGKLGDNQGLKMSAADIASGIVERERLLRDGGWINGPIYPGPADNQIHDVREIDTDTIAKKMEDQGVSWMRSDKSRGSRKIGLQLLRDRLEASLRGEGAGIYWMNCCRASIALLPSLPRDPADPDDVDTSAEDHIYDETRYTVLQAGDRTAKVIPVNFPR